MPSYAYVARDRTGKRIAGTQEGASKEALATTLREKGLTVSKVEEKKAVSRAKAKSGGGFQLFKGKVKLRDLSIFCRQFATMINAGVSLVRCLDVLEQQTSSFRLKQIIRDIGSEIEAGASLSRAMGKHPRVFSNLSVGLVRAGEVGGVLDDTLERLAGFMESDMELRRKVKAAMTYPVIVMIMAAGIVIFLSVFILPKFVKLFSDLGMKKDQFPMMTLMLMNFSSFIITYWWAAIMIVVGVWLGFNRLKRTKTGGRYLDMIKLKIPVMGSLTHKIAMARFSRTLSTLLSSGVPILQAMETTAGTVDNVLIQDAILAARASIREGDTIADPLAASRQFPPMVVQMISIGEETGQLDSMLQKVAEFYESEVDAALEGLTSAIEPVMIVGLGGVVLFILIALWMPLIGVIQNLSQ
jgi:type IV pilus assembly protein PilC